MTSLRAILEATAKAEDSADSDDGDIVDASHLYNVLKQREWGTRGRSSENPAFMVKYCERRVNKEYNDIVKLVNALRASLEKSLWNEIEVNVGDLIYCLLDNNANQLFEITDVKKQRRELFAKLGGVQLFIKVARLAFRYQDPYKAAENAVEGRTDVLNEVMVILRELTYVLPSSSDAMFSDSDIVFFFSFVRYHSLFDNVLNFLEEVVATREEPFNLALIPGFYALVDRMEARHLAHFCRVLSLLLFEPEDRQIMEGSHVLTSSELLQLRRNRLSKNACYIVEKNQCLIIEKPELLSRLVQILRIVNYGPELQDLIRNNIGSQVPMTSDILNFKANRMGSTDWDHFEKLEELIEAAKQEKEREEAARHPNGFDESFLAGVQAALGNGSSGSNNNNNNNNSVPPSRNTVHVQHGNTSNNPNSGTGASASAGSDDILEELLQAFAPAPTPPAAAAGAASADGAEDEESGGGRMHEFTSLINVMMIASRNGIATLTPLGNAILATQPNLMAEMIGSGAFNATRRVRLDRSTLSVAAKGLKAKKEMQFHAMLLTPYRVELIFVLCTVLSGRRKLRVQDSLRKINLIGVLKAMFERMSWDAPPFQGRNPIEHVHGPDCECNPESAVRVQFLRLIHNLFDRDFTCNPNKLLMLSPAEQKFVFRHFPDGVEKLHNGSSSIFRKTPSLDMGGTAASSVPLAAEVGLMDDDDFGSMNNDRISALDDVHNNHNNNNDNEKSNKAGTASLGEAGLLRRIIQVLMSESKDSVYRFWLSSCIENFLRGCGPTGQHFVAHCGTVHHIAQFIVQNAGANMGTNSLQSAFDLLGETTKCNPAVLQLLNDSLDDEDFDVFTKVVMENLIDSNVFLRSCFLSLELLSHNYCVEHKIPTFSVGEKTSNANGIVTCGNEKSVCIIPQEKNTGFFLNSVSESLFRQTPAARTYGADSSSSSNGGGSSSNTEETHFQQRSYLTQSWVPCAPPIVSPVAEAIAAARSAPTAARDSNSGSKDISDTAHLQKGFRDAMRSMWKKTFSTKNQQAVDTSSNAAGSADEKEENTGAAATRAKRVREYGSASSSSSSSTNYDDHHHHHQQQHQHQQKQNQSDKRELPVSESLVVAADDDSAEDEAYDTASEGPADSMPTKIDDRGSDDVANGGKNAVFTLFANNKIIRLARFLLVEKVTICFRLICAVTLETITHENICCLNTTLFILLMEQRRGRDSLLALLSDVRRLAAEQVMEASLKKNSTCTGSSSSSSSSSSSLLRNTPLKSSPFASPFATPATPVAVGVEEVRVDDRVPLCVEVGSSPMGAILGGTASVTDSNAFMSAQKLQKSVVLVGLRGKYKRALVADNNSGGSSGGSQSAWCEAAPADSDSSSRTSCNRCTAAAAGTTGTTTDCMSGEKTVSNGSTEAYTCFYKYNKNSRTAISTDVNNNDDGESESAAGMLRSCRTCGTLLLFDEGEKSSCAIGAVPIKEDHSNENTVAATARTATATSSGADGSSDTGNNNSCHSNNEAHVMVFENFRRQLWYWQEYYTRRGRDRLSIEFSSHIPFHLWSELVASLCRDDGSDLALLSAPIQLPMSPYLKPTLSAGAARL